MSYRVSFMRPVVFDPGPFGEFGGPANDGFAGTGTNKSFSTAGNWTRVFSNTTVMDVRGGVNYYHNIAISEGSGLTTQHRHRHPRRQPRRVHQRPVAASRSAATPRRSWVSRPACPGTGPRRRGTSRRRVTKLMRTHTLKIGGEWRHNRDMLLQTQDAGGSRGQFNFNASGTGPSDRGIIADRRRQLVRVVPARLAERRHARPEGHRRSRARSTRRCSSSFRTNGRRDPNVTIDLGLRWEYYTPLRASKAPAASPTTTRSPTRCEWPASAPRTTR